MPIVESRPVAWDTLDNQAYARTLANSISNYRPTYSLSADKWWLHTFRKA